MTTTSTGPRSDSSFSPSCSGNAVNRERPSGGVCPTESGAGREEAASRLELDVVVPVSPVLSTMTRPALICSDIASSE